jgi:hypothetical protein
MRNVYFERGIGADMLDLPQEYNGEKLLRIVTAINQISEQEFTDYMTYLADTKCDAYADGMNVYIDEEDFDGILQTLKELGLKEDYNIMKIAFEHECGSLYYNIF